ncbi:unnamed protein product [Enterobius vermicularis]|uniref:CUB domain-containing protein n=1 Tax=Enterobius vermicularis TaxID=51028 RepID=A0A0N4USH1_ENTVE|nr:unnamed protein product [Enterobius vermicularis]
METEMKIVAGNTAVQVYLQDTYLEENLVYKYGNSEETILKVDSSIDLNTFKSFLFRNATNLTISYTSELDNSTRWTQLNSITISSVCVKDIGDTKCPGGTNGASIAINGTIFLFSDYYQENETRSYQKNCEWNYIAPPSGWLTVLKVLALDMSDNEVLNVTGSINGNQSTRVFDRTGTEPVGVYYYDSELRIRYARQSAVKSSTQAFRILLTTMKLENKTCSLAYNSRSYNDLKGNFTNMRTKLQYPKNEVKKFYTATPVINGPVCNDCC